MSTVRRSVVINPVEASPLSFRAPMGIETWVDVTYYDQSGNPHQTDLAGQLQLTARSTLDTQSYAMTAIDVANGKARAVLPVGAISDGNGYRLRLFGTVDSQMDMVAVGTVIPTEAVTPEVIPPDVIDNIPLAMQRGIAVDLQVDLWTDDGKSVEYNLATSTLTANVWADDGESTVLAPFAISILDNNSALLHLDAAIVDTLPDLCWWSLVIASGLGSTTLAHGSVTVAGVAPGPPPLTPFTGSWDYQTPDQGAPLTGQIVQQNWVRNILLISPVTYDSVDANPTLSVLRAGDTITSGTTVWSVVDVALTPGGWYEVTVSPLTQLTAGTATFSFARP